MDTMTEEDVDLNELIDEDNESNHFKKTTEPAPPGSIVIAECGVLYRVKGQMLKSADLLERIKDLCPNCVAAVACS